MFFISRANSSAFAIFSGVKSPLITTTVGKPSPTLNFSALSPAKVDSDDFGKKFALSLSCTLLNLPNSGPKMPVIAIQTKITVKAKNENLKLPNLGLTRACFARKLKHSPIS